MQHGSTRTFKTAEEYLRTIHPQCAFVFAIIQNAVDSWGYSLEDACKLQSDIVALACEDSKRRDAQRGLQIVIEDESYSAAA